MKSLVLIQFEFKGLVAPYNAQPRPWLNFISRLENNLLGSMAKNNPNTALLWGYQSHYHLLTLNLWRELFQHNLQMLALIKLKI